MLLETPPELKDFELLDTGNGFRLERWGKFVLQRPDPQIIWQPGLSQNEWQKADAVFEQRGERGKWLIRKSLPQSWPIEFTLLARGANIKLLVKLAPFKHTGIFPEQTTQWQWLENLLGQNEKLKILNLFAYTGGATMYLTKLGHFITHVDASKPSIAWAKENQKLNNFSENSIRWILDDAGKFVEREIKREQTYDGIIMDPPAFGHSPSGATWKFNRDLPKLLKNCVRLLSPRAKFLIINAYATNSSALALKNILEDSLAKKSGEIEFGELCLKQKNGRLISTGIFARWKAK